MRTASARAAPARTLRWIALLLAAGLIACAQGGGAGTPGQAGRVVRRGSPGSGGEAAPKAASPFPSAQELEKLGAGSAPERVVSLEVRDVETWELTGPFPERIDDLPYIEPTPWGELLTEVVRTRPGLVVPTHAMHCVAGELGRFYLAHGGRPPESLRRFIAGRCQASGARISYRYLHSDVLENDSEQRIYNQWALSASQLVADEMVGGPRTIGLWFGRRGSEAVLLVASGLRDAHLEPMSTVVDADRRLRVRGESLRAAEEIWAVMGRGRYGFADCIRDPGVELPRFAFSCELDPEDGEAWISIGVREPERLLASWGVDILARAPGEESTRYRRPSYAEPLTVADADAADRGLVDIVNRVRRDAGLGPLEAAPEQSRTARELAPHYFSSRLGQTSATAADLVALGMLAGWQVDGIVQTGHFSASWVVQTHDAERLLAEALSYPVSRRTLLAPEADRIAVGSVVGDDDKEGYLAAIFGTYALFAADAHQEIAHQVYEKLEADRRARGASSPHHLVDIALLSMQAASRVEGGEVPADVFDDLLQASMQVLGRSVTGWVAEVQSLEDLEFPEDFIERPSLGVAIGVSYRKPEDEPWGRYVVMLVVAEPEGRRA